MPGHEVLPRRRDQDREFLQQRRAARSTSTTSWVVPVTRGVLELVREPPVGGAREAREGEGRAQAVAREALEAEPVVSRDGDAGVHVEPLHLRGAREK